MAGRGDFGEVEEIDNPLCKMLRNGRWQPMSEPINPDRGVFIYYHSGVGLAASFADEYAKYYGEEVGLIPCADGGTAIHQWQPGTPLLANAIMQCKLAMEYADAEIVGILWHQGESDSRTRERVDAYREQFMRMLDTLKKELSLSDSVPVLIGELGEYIKDYKGGELAYFEDINDTLRSISAQLPVSAFVSARGLTCKADGIHFNSASYREFGKRYFAAYRSLLEK